MSIADLERDLAGLGMTIATEARGRVAVITPAAPVTSTPQTAGASSRSRGSTASPTPASSCRSTMRIFLAINPPAEVRQEIGTRPRPCATRSTA